MKYKHQPSRQQIDGLEIALTKDKKGKIKGFTVWANGYWVLDGSIMKDKTEDCCRIYTGNRVQDLQFEYDQKGGFLELRSKKLNLKN